MWYRGLAIANDKVIPVVNGTAFLTPAEQVIARAAVAPMRGQGSDGMTSLNERRFVLFPLGEKRFALPAETVAELAQPDRLQTFPMQLPC